MQNEERSPLFLALDCGELPEDTVTDYSTCPAYIRARMVYTAIGALMIEERGLISTHTVMNYGHAFIIAYAPDVPHTTQQQVFRVMDRYRQEWKEGTFRNLQKAPGFVQFPEDFIQDCYKDRREKSAGRRGTLVDIDLQRKKATMLYESHQPRVMRTRQHGPPIPIEPPFASIPLFYERNAVLQQPKPSAKKTFLERYLTSLRTEYEQQEAEMRKRGVPSPTPQQLQAVGQAVFAAGLSARKYRFMPSAMSMVHALMADAGTVIKTLPSEPLIFEFAEPLQVASRVDPLHGIAFMQPFVMYQKWLDQDRKGRRHIFGDLTKSNLAHLWTANLLAEDGKTVCNLLYDTSVQRWRVPEIRICLTGECVQTMSPEEMAARGAFTNWELCPTCQMLLDFFSRWIPVALLMIEGAFAEEQEPGEQRVVEETTTYKEKRQGSGKYDEKRQKSMWRIVSFDASVKKPTRYLEKQEANTKEGPNWVELGIAAGTLFKMDITLGRVTRHLVPGPNKPWKTEQEIKVEPHPTKVTVTLETLRKRVQKVTKVTASTYEERERKGKED